LTKCHCGLPHSTFAILIGEETNIGVIARRAVCAEAIPNLLVGDCFAPLAMTKCNTVEERSKSWLTNSKYSKRYER
jgi:hypothetical protein